MKGYMLVSKSALIENLVPEISKFCDTPLDGEHCLYIEYPCFVSNEGPLNDADVDGAY